MNKTMDLAQMIAHLEEIAREQHTEFGLKMISQTHPERGALVLQMGSPSPEHIWCAHWHEGGSCFAWSRTPEGVCEKLLTTDAIRTGTEPQASENQRGREEGESNT